MRRGLSFSLAGLAGLAALAGCGRDYVPFSERPPWRQEAELACMKSGSVKIGSGIVQSDPIEGPGMCGANFPLKVAALGENVSLGFADELRPPGSIPTGTTSAPRWPVSQPRYAPPPPAPARYEPPFAPNTLSAPSGQPLMLRAPGIPADDIPDDAILPPGRVRPQAYPQTQPAYNAPAYPAPAERRPPALGPMRGPRSTGAIMPATVKPTATLACPMVSALDHWVREAVQPAAMRWFGQPVAEIKQISAYSCRGMVGAGTSRISEHAFGNALDIAAFILADGRKVTVKNGWHGAPEESGFLHDVQGAACGIFSTVLAPGYNAAHYDHIHVDLMRRASGSRPCRPTAIPGEVAAARAAKNSKYAKRGDPTVTGSIGTKPDAKVRAIPGEDGYFDDDDDAGVTTGSIAQTPVNASARQKKMAIPGEDGYFAEDEARDQR